MEMVLDVYKRPYDPQMCNIFSPVSHLAGKRRVNVTERKTKRDWACFLEEIAEQYKRAGKKTLVMFNLNTHAPGSLYETFQPDKAKQYGTDSSLYTPRSMGAG